MINILGQSYILAARLDDRNKIEGPARKLSRRQINQLSASQFVEERVTQSRVMTYVRIFFHQFHALLSPKGLEKCSSFQKH